MQSKNFKQKAPKADFALTKPSTGQDYNDYEYPSA
jgi:hypothetical protein